MLRDQNAIATVAVNDLETAKRFYEDKLGLQSTGTESAQAITYRTGGGTLLVYASQFAGTNQATSVTWKVGDDFDELMRDLTGKGVPFERYDGLPGLTLDGNVHRHGDIKLAWFKDPDGNIHHLINL
jgi:catechol 2,3-dioxygenase-like lactoylglutathione lyase family enzyme